MRKLYPGRTEEQYAVQFAEYEYILLKESQRRELEAGSTFYDCLKGTDRRRTFCAVLPQMSQSFCGQSLISTQVMVLLQFPEPNLTDIMLGNVLLHFGWTD